MRLKAIESAHADHQTHRELVLKKKKKIDKEKLRKKLEIVQKKESAMVGDLLFSSKSQTLTQENSKQREKDENGKTQIMQKKWFVIVTLAARIGYIQRTLEVNANFAISSIYFYYDQESRTKLSKLFLENHAARVIQAKWHVFSLKQQELRKKAALGKIALYVIALNIIVHVFNTFPNEKESFTTTLSVGGQLQNFLLQTKFGNSSKKFMTFPN
ncbi:hypothetical protein HDU82_008023 [Entophlyctis luteolus]|nr:hypothetical protein HDU82_008023 [Entophlyctis luteolus]